MHMTSSPRHWEHRMGLASLQIQNSNNADVLLDSGLNLFDIIANLCSKLYYEVLLKSGNYIVNILKQTLIVLGF